MSILLAGLAVALYSRAPVAVIEARFLGELSDRAINFRLETYPDQRQIEELISMPKSGNSSVDFTVRKAQTYRLCVSAKGMLPLSMLVFLTPGQCTTLGPQKPFIGDVNADNKIDSKDIDQIRRYSGSRKGSSRWEFGDDGDRFCGRNCDLNGDGIVDSKDIEIVKRTLLRQSQPNRH
jgi:hypothetical protein